MVVQDLGEWDDGAQPPLNEAQRTLAALVPYVALLLCDVVGFTRLSECYAKLGTDGCEQFTGIISRYFTELMDCIVAHGGDVECFAGDALVVAFQPAVGGGLAQATCLAAQCMHKLLQDYATFQPAAGDPPLALHAALAAGTTHPMEVAGPMAARWEAVLAGQALTQLGTAHEQSEAGECMVSEAAWALIDDRCQGTLRDRGCVLLLEILRPEPLPSKPGLSRKDSLFAGAGAVPPPPEPDARALARFEAVRRYVPRVVWERSLANLPDMIAEHRMVTVAFVIVPGAAIQGPGGPEDTSGLERLQDAAGDAIDLVECQWGGATRQIAMDEKGVALIFVFGLPGFIHDRPAVRAVFAACALAESLGGAGLRPTVGVTTGFCYCGPVGSVTLRAEYCVVGDTVNLAARLAAKSSSLGETVLCDEATARGVDGQRSSEEVRMRGAGTVTVKGKSGPIEVYAPEVEAAGRRPSGEVADGRALLAKKRVAEGSGAPVMRHPVMRARSFIGRAGEVERVRSVAARTLADRKPQLVVLEGRPGMGKSALLGEVESQILVDGGWMILSGATSSIDTITPFFYWRQILWHFLCAEYGLTQAGAQRYAEIDLPFPDPAEHGPAPAILQDEGLRVALDAATKSPYGPRRLMAWSAVWARLVRLISARGPVAILIEDLHWMDRYSFLVLEETVSVTDQLYNPKLGGAALPAWGPAALLLLATTRHTEEYPGFLKRRFEELCDHAAERVLIGSMDSGEVLEVARHVLKVEDVAPDVIEVVESRSAGVPLYIRELCQYLMDQGALYLSPDRRCELRNAKAALSQIPSSLLVIITAHIDRLPPNLALVLKVAAVLGERFFFSHLLGAMPTPMSPAAVERALRLLQDAGFIHPEKDTDGLLCFKHVLYKDVAYGQLLHVQKRRIHRLAAQDMDELMGGPDTPKDSRWFAILPWGVYHWENAVGLGPDLRVSKDATQADLRGCLKVLMDNAKGAGIMEECQRADEELDKCRAVALALDPSEERDRLEQSILVDQIFNLQRWMRVVLKEPAGAKGEARRATKGKVKVLEEALANLQASTSVLADEQTIYKPKLFQWANPDALEKARLGHRMARGPLVRLVTAAVLSNSLRFNGMYRDEAVVLRRAVKEWEAAGRPQTEDEGFFFFSPLDGFHVTYTLATSITWLGRVREGRRIIDRAAPELRATVATAPDPMVETHALGHEMIHMAALDAPSSPLVQRPRARVREVIVAAAAAAVGSVVPPIIDRWTQAVGYVAEAESHETDESSGGPAAWARALGGVLELLDLTTSPMYVCVLVSALCRPFPWDVSTAAGRERARLAVGMADRCLKVMASDEFEWVGPEGKRGLCRPHAALLSAFRAWFVWAGSGGEGGTGAASGVAEGLVAAMRRCVEDRHGATMVAIPAAAALAQLLRGDGWPSPPPAGWTILLPPLPLPGGRRWPRRVEVGSAGAAQAGAVALRAALGMTDVVLRRKGRDVGQSRRLEAAASLLDELEAAGGVRGGGGLPSWGKVAAGVGGGLLVAKLVS